MLSLFSATYSQQSRNPSSQIGKVADIKHAHGYIENRCSERVQCVDRTHCVHQTMAACSLAVLAIASPIAHDRTEAD